MTRYSFSDASLQLDNQMRRVNYTHILRSTSISMIIGMSPPQTESIDESRDDFGNRITRDTHQQSS